MNGFENENQFKLAFDNKNFDSLSNNLQSVILSITKDIKPQHVIKVLKSEIRQKSDLPLMIDNEVYNISIKKGSGNSLHQEKINEFINYLKNNFGIDEEIFSAIKRYVWADGTVDGSGKISERISGREFKKRNPEDILKINNYFKKHQIDLIKRFVINGSDFSKKIDFLLYGDIINCKIVSSNSVLEFLKDTPKNGVLNVGGLTFQAWNRNINGGNKSENKRGEIQLKWGTLKSDIDIIVNNEKKYWNF